MINQSPAFVHQSGDISFELNPIPLICDTPNAKRHGDGTARVMVGDNYRHDDVILIISDIANLE
jgi:hypothetical protein